MQMCVYILMYILVYVCVCIHRCVYVALLCVYVSSCVVCMCISLFLCLSAYLALDMCGCPCPQPRLSVCLGFLVMAMIERYSALDQLRFSLPRESFLSCLHESCKQPLPLLSISWMCQATVLRRHLLLLLRHMLLLTIHSSLSLDNTLADLLEYNNTLLLLVYYYCVSLYLYCYQLCLSLLDVYEDEFTLRE